MLAEIGIEALTIADAESETFAFADLLADLVASMTFFKEVVMIAVSSFLSMTKDQHAIW